ncbi:MAG: threonine synthase [Propionibacteriaceae bacterium]|jgi:threonine synthase|nr:threonine synthase [Propionibacteriaceae bacterium]
MRYISTRGYGADRDLGFTDILLEGLAPDGGLYVPETYPTITADDLTRWRSLLAETGYAAVAAEILARFADDIDPAELRAMCDRAYTAEKFGTTTVAPVTKLEDGLFLAHLSEGPTAAFKDMAMQLLAQFFDAALAKRDTRLTIVGATSGDTGSAAEHAMLTVDRVQVFMLSPEGRMTPFQRQQMYGIDDPRVVNVVVPGSFDDCQDLVKAVNADAAFKSRHRIGAVNSINWARIVAQVVYYITSWIQVAEDPGDEISFAVPSGNFGNILSAHVARMMGLPIRRLICATNENNVLAEFFETGVYRIRSSQETHATSSPSMDISKASNFERFFFDLTGRDVATTARMFGEELATSGVIDISGSPLIGEVSASYGFVAGTSTHADRVATIAEVHRDQGVLIDPHTADGVTVARRFVGEEPIVVTETALPVKFAATIREAIGADPEIPPRFAGVMDSAEHIVPCHKDVEELKGIIEERSLIR